MYDFDGSAVAMYKTDFGFTKAESGLLIVYNPYFPTTEARTALGIQ